MLSATAATQAGRICARTLLACVFLVNSAITPLTGNSAEAESVIADAWGIAVDPIKLGRASQNILNSVEQVQLLLNQIGSVETRTNQDLADRISQMKSIVDGVVLAVDQNVANLREIITEAEQKIVALEKQIYLDAESLLDRVQCVAENIMKVQLQEAIADSVAELIAANVSINVRGFKIFNLRLKEIQVTDPDQAYISVRDGYLRRLNALKPNDSAYTIVSAYANIERRAQEASCLVPDPTVQAELLKEEFEYRRLAGAWAVVPVTMAR